MKGTTAEIKHARRIAKKYSLTPPVDVQKALLDYADLEKASLPSKVDAICIIDNSRRPLVIVDQFLPSTREKFTLAHELGHLIIPWHYGMISCHTDRRDEYDERLYRDMETEANNFAAELIMPSAWIEQLIVEELDNGLDALLKSIAKKAEVSFSAAFFTVFKCLPKGYISYIENTSSGQGKFSETQDTKIFIPFRGDREASFEWLDMSSSDKNMYDMDTFIIKWWRVEDRVTEKNLTELIQTLGSKTLTGLLTELMAIDKSSMAMTFELLIGNLPEGYVLSFEDEYSYRIFTSENTPVHVQISERTRKPDRAWLSQQADLFDVCNAHSYRIYWWYFIPKKVNLNRVIDERQSQVIFREILEDTYFDEYEKTAHMRSMAGIVGALNNKKFETFDEFYSQLHLRLTAEKNFEMFLSDPRMENFMVNKVNELLKRRKKI